MNDYYCYYYYNCCYYYYIPRGGPGAEAVEGAARGLLKVKLGGILFIITVVTIMVQ